MKHLLTLCLAALSVTCASAQTPPPAGGSKADFDKFRRGMLDDYKAYRKGVFDRYDKFLEGVWKDFERFKAEKSDSVPKPLTMPVAPEKPKVPATPAKPTVKPGAGKTVKPAVPAMPSQPTVKPGADKTVKPAVPAMPAKPLLPSAPSFAPAFNPAQYEALPEPVLAPVLTIDNGNVTDAAAGGDYTPLSPLPLSANPAPPAVLPVVAAANVVAVDFYGQRLSFPKCTPRCAESLSERDMAKAWRNLNDDDAKKAVKALDETARALHLPDYLTYELIDAYATAVAAGAENAKALFKHYALIYCGFDVRPGLSDGQLYTLLPFEQKIYARPYYTVDNRRYYVFSDKKAGSMRICTYPEGTEAGRGLNLVIRTTPKLTPRPKAFHLTDGKITVKGEVNATVMEMLRRYPQMPVPMYAASVVDGRLRADIVRQVREQVAGLPVDEAANRLLGFVQHAFAYATDQVQFGYEKPFFFEELLYYPKCDCEDRSVFYSYLVRQCLGLDVHLLHYPGHECTAVGLRAGGYGYPFGSTAQRYTIADPTFIGAGIGDCMPSYRSTRPNVEFWYK